MTVFLAFAESSIQLVPDGTLLFHVLAVVVMIAILNRTLYRPINKILKERERETKGRITEAEKALSQSSKTAAHYEQALREARSSGYQLAEAERSVAMASREQTLATLRDELRLLIQNEKAEIGAQTEQARVDLKRESGPIAERITAQILARSVGSTNYTP